MQGVQKEYNDGKKTRRYQISIKMEIKMKRNVWKLKKRPEGINFEDALSLIEEDINDISDGNLIIKNKIISMDAGTRMWMSDREDSYQPPLEIGANMVGVLLGGGN